MRLQRVFWTIAALAFLNIASAQLCPAQQGVPELQSPSLGSLPHVSPLISLTSIPVPYDPLEMVTNNARQVETPEERAAVMDLLDKAHRLSNVRLHAYELKTSFVSHGSSSSDGPWILEDVSPGPNVYRWTAQGPSFYGVYLNANKLLSSNQPGGAMPLRLAQIRDAMWGIYAPGIGPHATLRVANGSLNGAELRCVLVAHGIYGSTPPQFSGGRSFDEAEYCVDPQTGLLDTYSPYAGLYVRFSYVNALHFHEQLIPDGFTITQRGRPVIEAKTESVGDAPPKNSNLFEPGGLNPLGVGQAIVPPLRVRGIQTSPSLGQSATGEVVVVHGMVSPNGQFTEAEILASTNSDLESAAIDHANKAPALKMGLKNQPGTTPQAREVIFTIQFVPRQPQMGPGVGG